MVVNDPPTNIFPFESIATRLTSPPAFGLNVVSRSHVDVVRMIRFLVAHPPLVNNPPIITSPSDSKAIVLTVVAVLAVNVVSSLHVEVTRATRLLAVHHTVVNPPAISILPSGCITISHTGPPDALPLNVGSVKPVEV